MLHIGRRIGGVAVGAIAAITLMLSPDFMVASTTARAEAIVIPLSLLALAIMLDRRQGLVGFAAAPALLLVATAARLTFLPAFIGALAFCYWSARPSARDTVRGLALLAVLAVVVSAPLLISPPGRVFFDVWTSQAARNDQFQPNTTPLYSIFSHRAAFLSLPALTFFVVLIPVLILAIYTVGEWQRGWRPSRIGYGGDPLTNYAAIAAFAFALWLPFAGFDHQEVRYFVPPVALLSIVAADAFVRARRAPSARAGA